MSNTVGQNLDPGVDNDIMFCPQATLRVNPRNYKDSYVPHPVSDWNSDCCVGI